MKKYCLLVNGSIEPCHFSNGEQRNIYKENGKWYLDHDVMLGNSICYCHHKIIKFADSKEELIKDANKIKS